MDDIDTIALIVSELTTNSLTHAFSPTGESGARPARMTLAMRLCRTCVNLEVFDSNPLPPHPRQNTPWDERGRGLQLVAALSAAWGVDPVVEDGQQIGKTVWAEVPVRFTDDARDAT